MTTCHQHSSARWKVIMLDHYSHAAATLGPKNTIRQVWCHPSFHGILLSKLLCFHWSKLATTEKSAKKYWHRMLLWWYFDGLWQLLFVIALLRMYTNQRYQSLWFFKTYFQKSHNYGQQTLLSQQYMADGLRREEFNMLLCWLCWCTS